MDAGDCVVVFDITSIGIRVCKVKKDVNEPVRDLYYIEVLYCAAFSLRIHASGTVDIYGGYCSSLYTLWTAGRRCCGCPD